MSVDEGRPNVLPGHIGDRITWWNRLRFRMIARLAGEDAVLLNIYTCGGVGIRFENWDGSPAYAPLEAHPHDGSAPALSVRPVSPNARLFAAFCVFNLEGAWDEDDDA